MTDTFWIDAEYDREHASDGVSRYGHYVRDGSFEPWDPDDPQPAELAVFAWQRATGPVMAPGYVRRHPRILSARVERSDHDGQLIAIAAVDLLTTAPRELRGAPLPGDGYWRDWPYEWSFAADHTIWRDPYGGDFAGGARFMLGSVSLQFPVTCELPAPSPFGADTETCMEAVAALVGELNLIAGPVIDRIEGN